MLKNKILVFALLIITSSPFKSQSQQAYQAEIKQAAIAFVNTLDNLHKHLAVLSFNDTGRQRWNNLPVGLRARSGMSVGNMTDDQRKLFHRLLSTSLSSQGYLKASSIMQLDNLLNIFMDTIYYRKEINDTMYKFMRDLLWSPKNYYLAFFGNPSDSIWGYKVEGHHLSVNFTFIKDKLSVTPWFVGTDPAEYTIMEYAGLRVLGQEEDLGLALIHKLNPAQQKKATMSSEVPGDIITAAESGKRLVDYWGLKGSEMSKEQQAILQYIIREYVFNMEYDKAVIEYDKILKAGVDNIYFGWIGKYAEKEPHYYILNGPTFLIEFDNNGGPRKVANHIHTIWREKGNEYGDDVLRKHYLSEKH